MSSSDYIGAIESIREAQPLFRPASDKDIANRPAICAKCGEGLRTGRNLKCGYCNGDFCENCAMEYKNITVCIDCDVALDAERAGAMDTYSESIKEAGLFRPASDTEVNNRTPRAKKWVVGLEFTTAEELASIVNKLKAEGDSDLYWHINGWGEPDDEDTLKSTTTGAEIKVKDVAKILNHDSAWDGRVRENGLFKPAGDAVKTSRQSDIEMDRKREYKEWLARYVGASAVSGKFGAFLKKQYARYGEDFDPSLLCPQFIPYYNSGLPVRVLFKSRPGKEFEIEGDLFIGTEIPDPQFMLMRDDSDSGWVLKEEDIVVKVLDEAGLFKPASDTDVSLRKDSVTPEKVMWLSYCRKDSAEHTKIRNPAEIRGLIQDFWDIKSLYSYMSLDFEGPSSHDDTWEYLDNMGGQKVQVGDKIVTVPVRP